MDRIPGIDAPHVGWFVGLLSPLFLASLIAWGLIAAKVSQRQPLVELAPRRPVPWQWTDVVVGFLLYLLLPLVAVVWLHWQLDISSGDEQPQADAMSMAWRLAAHGAMTLLAVIVTAMLARVEYEATAADLGIQSRHAARNIRIGLVAFVAIAPVVYSIKVLLSRYSDVQHPLVLLIKNHPTLWLFAETAIVAVLVAPVVEEFLFRVLLQGWLEKIFQTFGNSNVAPLLAVDGQEEITATISDPMTLGWRHLLPIVISAAIFAAFHFENGLDPIPLFVLALVLGYLYQRTHRILPSLVVHMSLNALSMVMLGLAVVK